MGNINSCPDDYYKKDQDNRYRGAAKAMSEDINDVSMVDLREEAMDSEQDERVGLQQQQQMIKSGELTQSFSQMKIETEGDMHRSLSGRHSTTLIFEYDDDIPTAKQLEDTGPISNSDAESIDEDRIVPDNQEEDSSSLGESPAPQQRDLSSTPLPLLPGQEHRTEQQRLPSVMIPVELTWQQGGTKVYVTGSFTGWRKMIGLVPDPSRPKTFHIKLQLPPGTHRFRFIVDNELRFSDFLPTATDQMGNFVNYLEIVAPQMQKPSVTSVSEEQRHLQQEPKQQLQPPPQAAQEHRLPVPAHPVAEDEGLHTEHIDYDNTAHNQVSDSRQIVDNDFRNRSQLAMQIEEDPDDMGDGYSRFRENVKAKPEYEYTQDIPAVFTDPSVMGQYYLTLDQQQNNQQNLAWLTPPQLPPHLDHVILNMYNKSAEGGNENTSGALPIPNHVVLNHLATSSIKHNTLCVASIVRYKGKYATQILYAPLL